MQTEQSQQPVAGLSVPVDAHHLAVVHEYREVYQQWQAADSEENRELTKRFEHLQMRLAIILDALVYEAEKNAAEK
ncbi:hypothetical protein [Pseudomonas viridiflava]|uniref:hypothetical protein n=1 Tax=Pseudomonas viridiflava TaxID=33069 RepID=UPI000F01233C|nr:hypothetical protein [Pseudomonas viridiflava]